MGRHREKEPPMGGLKPKKYKSGRSPVDMSFYPPETPVREHPVDVDVLLEDMSRGKRSFPRKNFRR